MASIVIGEGRTLITRRVEALGRDLAAFLTGGEAHVGAVAVAGSRAGTAGEAFSQLIVVTGHKEGPLAEHGAALLAARSGRTCVLTVGIHIDDASGEEIAALVANASEALEQWRPGS